MEEKNKQKKQALVGKVVSDAMDKTVVVKTERTFMHPQFHKTICIQKKYKVHDEQETAKVGDIIEFYEGRPVSKTKYMYLSRVIHESNTGKA